MPRSNSSKYFLKESSLIRLYIILALSFCYFLIQLVTSHVSHSLILQVDAYHMLYNILALTCSIVTTKMCRNGANVKNTFGWTRIDVCGAVASLCFLAALCFSVMVEALQAMLHASHHEKMHYEEYVGGVGALGILVNALTWIVIGGYSYQQQGFLGSHKDGEDIIISPSARQGPTKDPRIRRPGPLDAFRDFFGCIFVIICALVVYFWKDGRADFFDPCVTILEVVILAGLSYKYAREAGYILLLTIPDHINVQTLLEDLLESFPEICDVHEFHVWQLTPGRIIASAHLVLQNSKDCWVIQNNVTDFLHTKGISHVTLQPEFIQINNVGASPATLKRRQCFLPCGKTDDCQEKKCCLEDEDENLKSLLVPCDGHGLDHSHRSQSLVNFRPKDSPKLKHAKSDDELNNEKPGPSKTLVAEIAPNSQVATVEDSSDSEDEDKQEMMPMI